MQFLQTKTRSLRVSRTSNATQDNSFQGISESENPHQRRINKYTGRTTRFARKDKTIIDNNNRSVFQPKHLVFPKKHCVCVNYWDLAPKFMPKSCRGQLTKKTDPFIKHPAQVGTWEDKGIELGLSDEEQQPSIGRIQSIDRLSLYLSALIMLKNHFFLSMLQYFETKKETMDGATGWLSDWMNRLKCHN